MADLLLRRSYEGLVAADEDAAEMLAGIKVGTLVKGNVTKSRNLGFHRKFMKMVRVVFDNQERYDNFNVFLNLVVKTVTGHVDVVSKISTKTVERRIQFGANPWKDTPPGATWEIEEHQDGTRTYALIFKAEEQSQSFGYIPKSISFSRMEQTEFEQLYSDTLQALIDRCMNGADPALVEQEVNRLLGFA